jgi:hypothetical protein
MAASRREIARRIAMAYALVGFVFLILYHFMLHPADPDSPLLRDLFYVFLPSILIASAILLDVVYEGLRRILDWFLERDEEI